MWVYGFFFGVFGLLWMGCLEYVGVGFEWVDFKVVIVC